MPRARPPRVLCGRALRLFRPRPLPALERVRGERATGPVRGYVATRSATATKTDTPILETPQSITVVPKDQITAQQTQTISQTLRYTPGVTLDTFSAGTIFDIVTVRGFQVPT